MKEGRQYQTKYITLPIWLNSSIKQASNKSLSRIFGFNFRQIGFKTAQYLFYLRINENMEFCRQASMEWQKSFPNPKKTIKWCKKWLPDIIKPIPKNKRIEFAEGLIDGYEPGRYFI